MTADDIFTDDDLKQAESHPTLGPAYFTGRRIAERFMAQFEAEHFKPLVDKLADEFRDRIYADIDTHLISDTESNLEGIMRRMTDATVNAIITGDRWALERYPLAQYHDGEKVRAAIMAHIGPELTDRRVSDLEAKLASANETIQFLRR